MNENMLSKYRKSWFVVFHPVDEKGTCDFEIIKGDDLTVEMTDKYAVFQPFTTKEKAEAYRQTLKTCSNTIFDSVTLAKHEADYIYY